MRKAYKVKKRACGLCKPHKKGWQKRWKPKDLARLQEDVKHSLQPNLEV